MRRRTAWDDCTACCNWFARANIISCEYTVIISSMCNRSAFLIATRRFNQNLMILCKVQRHGCQRNQVWLVFLLCDIYKSRIHGFIISWQASKSQMHCKWCHQSIIDRFSRQMGCAVMVFQNCLFCLPTCHIHCVITFISSVILPVCTAFCLLSTIAKGLFRLAYRGFSLHKVCVLQ